MSEGLEALVAQVPDEVLDYIDDIEERLEKAEADLAAANGNPDDDPIEKALSELPAEVADLVKSQRTRLEKAEEALERERIEKANEQWIAKARSMDGLIDDPNEFGSQLREVAEINEDLAENLVKVLSAASERFAKADLYKEIGRGAGAVTGSAEEKVHQIAKSLREADPKLTEEQAMAEAWERNPDLYEEHVNERRASLKEV